MKVILLDDVKSLGKKGQVVEVSTGYARNYIIPKKLGVEANSKTMHELDVQKKQQEKTAAQQLLEARALAAEIEDKSIELPIKVGEGGKAFGAISTKEIVAAAAGQLNLSLDKKKISSDEPIKSPGIHRVKIKLHPKVTAELTVKVIEE